MRSRIRRGSSLLLSLWPTSTTTIRGILGNRIHPHHYSRVVLRRGPRPRRTVPRSSSPGARRSCRGVIRRRRGLHRETALRGGRAGRTRRPRAGRSARRRALHLPRTTARRRAMPVAGAGLPAISRRATRRRGSLGGARPRARTAAARPSRAGRRTRTAASRRVRRPPTRGTRARSAATRTSRSWRRRNSIQFTSSTNLSRIKRIGGLRRHRPRPRLR